ncbi:MAG: hypothetical protein ACRDPY_43015 [Streptosporangiaceae bacterium]
MLLSPLAVLLLGIIMLASGSSQSSDGFGNQDSPGSPALVHWGIALIIIPVVLLVLAVIAGIIWLIAKNVDENSKSRQAGYAPQQQYAVGSSQQGIPVSPLAEAAVLGAGALAAHEAMKLHQRHVNAKIAARRQSMATAAQYLRDQGAANVQRQDNAAAGLGWRTNDQIGYGALVQAQRAPRPTRVSLTPRCDDNGDVYYR